MSKMPTIDLTDRFAGLDKAIDQIQPGTAGLPPEPPAHAGQQARPHDELEIALPGDDDEGDAAAPPDPEAERGASRAHAGPGRPRRGESRADQKKESRTVQLTAGQIAELTEISSRRTRRARRTVSMAEVLREAVDLGLPLLIEAEKSKKGN